MSGLEALEAMREGKRVRLNCWPEEYYLVAQYRNFYKCLEFILYSKVDGVDEERRILHDGLLLLEELISGWEVVE